jgi:hypothetical protein
VLLDTVPDQSELVPYETRVAVDPAQYLVIAAAMLPHPVDHNPKRRHAVHQFGGREDERMGCSPP